MENNQGNGSKKIYVSIIILLFLINCVAFYLLYTENNAKNQLTVEKTNLDKQLESVKDSLNSKVMELEAFRGKNAELDSIITAKEADIEKQKGEIQHLKARGNVTAGELTKAKEMVTQDETAISDLQHKIDELTKQNQQLTNQNQQLSTDLSTEKQTSSKLTEQNAGLSKKVELGSLLHLQKVTIEGISKNKSGKESVEKRIKKVQSLKISFETGDNKVLEAGKVSLFVRILNPKGEVISIADQGSGTMKDAVSNETLQYTKEADFDWAQTNKQIVVYWSDNIKDPGTYKIEIYQSGYKVGEASSAIFK
jgi:myosin heavy subunit